MAMVMTQFKVLVVYYHVRCYVSTALDDFTSDFDLICMLMPMEMPYCNNLVPNIL